MPFAAPIARVLLRSQSDERLVRLAREGHEGAFEEIVRRYRAPLVAFATSYAPAGGAEDVVQESFANAWIALEGSDRDVALKPWLYTIVRNRSLNAKRDMKHHSELDENIDGVRRPDEIVLQRDELARAVAAVSALPDQQRKALVESAIEGRTHDQIAAELGTSPGSVRGLIHRGRVSARGALGSAIPVPLVAWAAGSGGVMAGGVAAGGSLAAKGVAVAAIAVLATGSGLVVERSLDDSAKPDREAGAAEGQNGGRDTSGPRRDGDGVTGGAPGDGDGSLGAGRAPDRREDQGDERDDETEGEDGDDDSGGGDHHSGDDDSSGPGGGDDDSSGPGGSGGDDDSSGSGGGGHSSDSGSGGDSSGSGGDDSSGSSDGDSSGSGSSGSGSSGSGSGSSGSDDDPEHDED